MNSCCPEICTKPQNASISCSKNVLVNVFPVGEHYRERKVYCLRDDQNTWPRDVIQIVNIWNVWTKNTRIYNMLTVWTMHSHTTNRSLASFSFFYGFNTHGPEMEYVFSTSTGRSVTSGRRASGFEVRSLDGSCTLTLPSLIECNKISDNRNEMLSKVVSQGY